jgi:hypothetical protein
MSYIVNFIDVLSALSGSLDLVKPWFIRNKTTQEDIIDDLIEFTINVAQEYRNQDNNYLADYLIRTVFSFKGIDLTDDFDKSLDQCRQLMKANPDEHFKKILFDGLHELSITSFYLGKKKFGLRVSEFILLSHDTNKLSFGIDKSLVANNEYFYLNQLQAKKEKDVPVNMPIINIDLPNENYRPMNPSLLKLNDGYLVICRGVNYDQVKAAHFTSLDKDGKIRSKNFIIKLDTQLNKIYQYEIVDKFKDVDRYPSKVIGFEDCCLIEGSTEESIKFICTTLDTNVDNSPQISLVSLSKNSLDLYYFVENIQPMISSHSIEKNWLPFYIEKDLHIIYWYDPIVIRKIDTINDVLTGYTKVVSMNTNIIDTAKFRGSCGPLKFELNGKDGYLVIVHEILFLEDGRVYTHRFIWLSTEFELKFLTEPWYFDHRGIEFCKGMTYSHEPNQIMIGVGIEDCKACLFSINIDTIKNMLSSVDSFIL